MTVFEHLSGTGGIVPPGKRTTSLSSSFKSFARHVATWVRTSTDCYAAAARYERLSNLSNAELHRRGLSRDRLARHVFESCETVDR